MVGINNSSSGDPFSFANFQAELAKRGKNLEPSENPQPNGVKADPIIEALRISEKLEEIEDASKSRQKGEVTAARILNYQPISISESSEANQRIVNVSDIKTSHDFTTQSTPTESILKLKSNSFGLEQLESIENKIFDRKIIRNERSTAIRIEDEIKLAESDIRLKVSIEGGAKSIKVLEKGEEKQELKFKVSQINDNQKVEVPSFSPEAVNGKESPRIFFHKKPLKPYADETPRYEAETAKYKMSIDKGIITIRDRATDNLYFLQDGEGRNYIFHPEKISETNLAKEKNKLMESSSSVMTYRDTLVSRAEDINKLLKIFKEHGNPPELRIRFSEANPEGQSEAVIQRKDLEKELIEAQKQILNISLNASEFLNQKELKEKSPSNAMILNPKQTVAMYADPEGGVQYFNAEAKSLYGINP